MIIKYLINNIDCNYYHRDKKIKNRIRKINEIKVLYYYIIVNSLFFIMT